MYYATEKNLFMNRIVDLVKSTYSEFGIQVNSKPTRKQFNKADERDKREFIKLIDKHRPPVEHLISYSCRNFLDSRGKGWLSKIDQM